MTSSRPHVGAVSPSTMSSTIGAARFVSVLVGLGTLAAALVLVTHTTRNDLGVSIRPYVGQSMAMIVVGFGLGAILLFLAAWAEAWRDAELDAATRSSSSGS